MLIYIEMYQKDRLLNGPKCSVSELKKRLAKILAEAETKDFISIFCARYNFEEMPLDNVPINENIEVEDVYKRQVFFCIIAAVHCPKL